jgi:hypothetical protein
MRQINIIFIFIITTKLFCQTTNDFVVKNPYLARYVDELERLNSISKMNAEYDIGYSKYLDSVRIMSKVYAMIANYELGIYYFENNKIDSAVYYLKNNFLERDKFTRKPIQINQMENNTSSTFESRLELLTCNLIFIIFGIDKDKYIEFDKYNYSELRYDDSKFLFRNKILDLGLKWNHEIPLIIKSSYPKYFPKLEK